MKEMTVTRYFPDDPGNKVFLVDAYITVCRTFRIEAKDRDEAVDKVQRRLSREVYNTPNDAEFIRNIADAQFHDAEELEVKCSGECDGNGEEKFY